MPPKNFDTILTRLKAQINISQNKKVAEALDISYDAFYARRQRDSFPEEKLRILSELRPNLNLDVEYILTGVPGSPRPQKIVLEPSKNNPAPLHIREVESTYNLSEGGVTMDDLEGYMSSKRAALEQVDMLLSKIKFDTTHTLLKNTLAELLRHGHMTIGAAEALLIIMRDDHSFYEEQLHKLINNK